MTDALFEPNNPIPRFQLEGVLPSSQRARLVAARDRHSGAAVVLKAPSFRDDEEATAREAALELEALAAAAATWRYTPDATTDSARREGRLDTTAAHDAIATRGSETASGVQPVVLRLAESPDGESHACLVMPHIRGVRLDRWVATHHPKGAPDDEVLRIARLVRDALCALHDGGFVHRRLSPDHVLICGEHVQLVGFGGATLRNAGYPGGAAPFDPAYTAPESRNEVSGRFNVPKADVFSLGLLLAFMATGERPSTNAGSPLTRTAAERLLGRDVSLSLLIGKCLQPLQKNRMGLTALREHLLTPPTEKTPGFGPVELIATWRQEDISALPVGTLSPGPLVNRASLSVDDTSAKRAATTAPPSPSIAAPETGSAASSPVRSESSRDIAERAHDAHRKTRWRWRVASVAIVFAGVYLALRQLT